MQLQSEDDYRWKGERKRNKIDRKKNVERFTHTNYIYILFPYTSGVYRYNRVYSLDTVVLMMITVVLNDEHNYESCCYMYIHTDRQDFSSIHIYYR